MNDEKPRSKLQRDINMIMEVPQYCPICAGDLVDNNKSEKDVYPYFCVTCWLKIGVKTKIGDVRP